MDLLFDPHKLVNRCTPRGWYDGRAYELTLLMLHYLIGDIVRCKQHRLIIVDIAQAFHNAWWIRRMF